MNVRRALALIAAGALLFTACGKEGQPTDVLSVVGSPTPTATARAVEKTDEPTATETDTPGPAGTAPTATAAAATQAPAPTSTPPPGETQPPSDGRYVYSYEGKGSDPTNPAAGEQSFKGERFDDISHSRDVYTIESTNSEEAGRVVTKFRWSDTRVDFLSILIQTQVGTFNCTFDPPLFITRFPVKPETYPTQNFKGEGNACDGKLDITIVRKEPAKDAAGKSWDSWQVKVRTEVRPPNLTIVSDETRWVAPELGVTVRSEGTSNGEYKQGATTFKFSGSATSILKKRP